MTEKLALNVEEAAALMGLSKPTMYTVVNRADFPKIYVGRRIVIPRQSFEDWLQKAAARGDRIGH